MILFFYSCLVRSSLGYKRLIENDEYIQFDAFNLHLIYVNYKLRVDKSRPERFKIVDDNRRVSSRLLFFLLTFSHVPAFERPAQAPHGFQRWP